MVNFLNFRFINVLITLKSPKNFFLLTLIFLASACKTSFKTALFTENNLPPTPNYSSNNSWAILPGHYPESLNISEDTILKKADVFYIYPTLLTDRKLVDWNADIWSEDVRNEVLQTAVKYQASAWSKAANLYVPFYRQAHYRIFFEPFKDQGIEAWNIAFKDVKRAFQYYLENFNKGKPIIIASHSQGSMHAKELIKIFFDNKPLKNQLVAAYLVGARILPNEFKTIQLMTKPGEYGGFVSWNSFKMGKIPKNYVEWYAGGVTTNPINWDNSKNSLKREHKGLLSKDLNIYPESLTVKVKDGLLLTSIPDIPGKLFLSFIKNYHFADINLFWKDIQLNAIQRLKAWNKKAQLNE